jgi:Leucine-rich repeat (LRR) protein
VTDAGLAHLKDCKNLTSFGLNGTQVTDAGLAILKDRQNLIGLALYKTPVTDAGLEHLKGLTNLASIELSDTKTTHAGIAALQKALPKCQIHWSDANKRAAAYVLSIGGIVSVNHQDRDIRAVPDLPKEPYVLTRATLTAKEKVTDAGLANFKDCKNLTRLELNGTRVTDAGLAHCKGIPLTALAIENTDVTDLGPLQGMPLAEVRLTPKKITRGLDVLRDMKSLQTIGIAPNQSWPAAEFWARHDKGEFK